MKRLVLLTFAFIVAHTLTAQVMVRNDFVIDRKEKKIRNRGLRFISVNLGKFSDFRFVMNGVGGTAMRIDVYALRHPQKKYSYVELADKVYVPNGNSVVPLVPVFLLMPPPRITIPVMNPRLQQL